MALQRIERILHKLAARRAAHLIPPGWDQRGEPVDRIMYLTRQLANYNCFIFAGRIPQNLTATEVHIQDWIRNYAEMYSLLARTFFPHYSHYQAYIAERTKRVMVMVLECEAAPVSAVMSGYVAPYVAMRQRTRDQVNDLELQGFMRRLLKELVADDLTEAEEDGLIVSGVHILRGMLSATIEHITLTAFDAPVVRNAPLTRPGAQPPAPAPIFDDSVPQPPVGMPEQELEQLPEKDSQPITPTEELFITYPLPRINGSTSSRRPPVPDLPRRDKE